RKIAIKRIRSLDRRVLCLRTLRELRLLKFFSDVCPHKKIIALVDLIKPVTRESFSEVYFVQEFMETDLHFVIQTQSLTESHHQYLVRQILSAVKWMHNAGIYRDLKPSNILVRFFCWWCANDVSVPCSDAREYFSTGPSEKPVVVIIE
ncbi:kinase-like domain-containing protein, partial [Mycena olivaceomarginata]